METHSNRQCDPNGFDRDRNGGIMDRHRDVVAEIGNRIYVLPEYIAALLQKTGVARIVYETAATADYERRCGE